MNWTRSETLALAHERCVFCEGVGLKISYGGHKVPCNCVFRAIFKICLKRFRQCFEKEKHLSHVTTEIYGCNGARRIVWGRKDEEYMADFILIAKRTLNADEYRVFSAHFLLGADSNLCCRQLKMDRGIFFHHVYRVMQKLGREFREVSPYPLFPLDEYFGGTLRGPRGGAGAIEVAETPLHPITGRKVVPLRAPVQRKRRTPRNPVLLAA